MIPILWAAAVVAALLPGDARAQSFGDELRATLLAEPELVLPAFPDTRSFQQARQADLTMLQRLTPVLFSNAALIAGPGDDVKTPPKMALITAPDCDCAALRQQLIGWANDGQMRLYEWPLDAAVLTPLQLDIAPSFVFENMIVRGDVPLVVLQKYLNRR